MICDGFYDDGLTVTLRWFYDDLGWLLWWPCGGL